MEKGFGENGKGVWRKWRKGSVKRGDEGGGGKGIFFLKKRVCYLWTAPYNIQKITKGKKRL